MSHRSNSNCLTCGEKVQRSHLIEGFCAKCLLSVNIAELEPIPTGRPLTPAQLQRLFPNLEIIQCCGEGGMGTVYKARQPNLERFVAIKTLKEPLSSDPSFELRFAFEARTLARLKHPNIIGVYDFGKMENANPNTGNDLFYLIMEYAGGTSLADLIEHNTLTWPRFLSIAFQVCDGLNHAHERGIVHRDIKPENILVNDEDHVWVSDFGLAKFSGNIATDQSLTQTGITLGSPHYMAPEQLDGSPSVDQRADIYSFGVVLAEMMRVLTQIGIPQADSKLMLKMEAIILQATARSGEQRFQSVYELRQEISKAVRRLEINSTPEDPSCPTRRGLLLSAAAMATLCSVGYYFEGQSVLGNKKDGLFSTDVVVRPGLQNTTIYWLETTTPSIQVLPFSSQRVGKLHLSGENPVDIAWNSSRSKLYWVTIDPPSIRRCDGQGENPETVIAQLQDGSNQKIAVGGQGEMENIFYSTFDSVTKTTSLHSFNPTSSCEPSLIKRVPGQIGGLALDHVRRRLYWFKYGIQSVWSMDTKTLDTSVCELETGGQIAGLTVEVSSGDFFWSDRLTNSVFRKPPLTAESTVVARLSTLQNQMTFGGNPRYLFLGGGAPGRKGITLLDLDTGATRLLVADFGSLSGIAAGNSSPLPAKSLQSEKTPKR